MSIVRDKERHFIMRKEAIYQKYIAIRNIYVSNNKYLKYIEKKLIEPKGELDKLTILFSNGQKNQAKKIIESIDMNNTSNQLDLTDTCRMLHMTTTGYTYFSSKHDICRQTIYWAKKLILTYFKRLNFYR